MAKTMPALVYERPWELAVREVPVPEPGEGEALIRTGYMGICGTDLHVWAGEVGGVEPPIVMGHEIVGEIVDAGGSRFRPGQRVVVEPLQTCGICRACREGNEHVCRDLKVLGVHTNGGGASYMRVPIRRLHAVPDGLWTELAALAEPVAVAVHMTKRAGISLGDTVFVIGGGPIGYLVAWVARAAGAGRIVVSEVSAPRAEFCRRAGFDAIDPHAEDPVAYMQRLTDGEGADVTVEVAGHPSAAGPMVAATRVRGTILVGGVHAKPTPTDLRAISARELTAIGARVYTSRDFAEAIRLLASGTLDVASLVTNIVPLDEAIPRGFEVLRESPSEMKVLIRF